MVVSRCLVVLLLFASSAHAQSPPPPPQLATAKAEDAPPIRRWFDLQNVHLASRFRWVESDAGRLTSSTHQWQPNLRGRVLLDRAARYSVNFNANSGAHFVSGWNNSGGGIGDFAGDFNVRQLFVAAEPIRGVQFEIGGLYLMRGENTEITTYDNDAYIVGERVTWRRAAGRISQIAGTLGHIGDYRTPNVFKRLDAMGEINYGQALVGFRLSPRINASADYTYEDGRDIVREGITIRLPEASLPLTAMRLDAYQRLADVTGQGFNVSADLRITSKFTVTGGVTHIDQFYLIPGYMSPNADRYERGTRVYSQGAYALTSVLSIGWFQGEAFNIDYPIPNQHRWEIVVTVNPTSALKSRRIF